MKLRCALLVVAVICFTCVRASYAVAPGQTDDFQDGFTAGWTNGGFGPPVVNIDTGGPAGAGDRFIEVTSTGGNGGPGSRLVTFNRAQWLGDYTDTGVTALEMDLRNPGSVTLSIRLGFKTDPFNDVGYLSDAFLLPADDMWHHAVFLISPATMTALGDPDPFNMFFMSPGEVRIIDRVDATGFEGDVIAAQLDIDNIRAVPEPTSWILLGVGAIPVALWRRGSRRRISVASDELLLNAEN